MNANIFLKEITIKEMESTGANISKMDENSVIHFDEFVEHMRIRYDAKVCMLYNGLNSGDHAAQEHKDGKAFDFVIVGGSWKIFDVIAAAIFSHFKGIGVYWNENALSFHIDTRENYAQWIGKKQKGMGYWDYSALIVDPRI